MTEKLSEHLAIHQADCERAANPNTDAVICMHQMADLARCLEDAGRIVKAWEDALDRVPSDGQFRLICGELSAQGLRDARAGYQMALAKIAKLKKLDSEAAEFVEIPIITRTNFTGEPPYVGWKGLGLALNEALDERDQLRELARKVDESPIGTVELYQTQHDGDDPFIEFEIRGSIECPTTYAGKRYKLVEVDDVP